MAINAKQLRELIVRPTLEKIALWSPAAENLVMGTAAQESKLGYYLKQLGKGPALGIYQCEPATHTDVVDYIESRGKVRWSSVFPHNLIPLGVDHKRLVYDLRYATMICRMHYYRIPEALPEADDIRGLSSYWKRYYNTTKGRGTIAEFIENYEKYVEG